MFVCVFSSHSFWTSSSLDVTAGVTQEEGHTGFLIHLLSAVRAFIFLARRIQPFLSLVDREVEFCVDNIILLTVRVELRSASRPVEVLYIPSIILPYCSTRTIQQRKNSCTVQQFQL